MSYRMFFFGLALSLSSSALATRPAPDTSAIKTVDLPASRGEGVDMIFYDNELVPVVRDRDEVTHEIAPEGDLGAAVDLLTPTNHIYTDLRRGLMRYRQKWSHLPKIDIPAGPAMKAGQEGKRIELLRQRLGLSAGTKFDKALADAVRAYQQAHGLEADAIAASKTIESLNLGASHYERLIMLNLERARTLPADPNKRYILVDAGSARLWMYEDGKPKDTMRVIVGNTAQETPMMAAAIRYAEINPYWNIPPDLIKDRVAPRVLSNGLSYLKTRRFEVLSDWTAAAQPIAPDGIDWQGVADGKEEVRIRQLPGEGNSMGEIKFMMPNDLGIYLHDTPDKALFNQEERWISNGCVRVEDARRLAAWLFGAMPKGKSPDVEERVDLPEPVPVYITYLTVGQTDAGDILFRQDPYKRDPELMARLFGNQIETASRE